MRALVAGWFSFKYGHTTAGDLLARDLACQWLAEAGFAYDIALAPPFIGGVDWRVVPPQHYSHVLFVCGPFNKEKSEQQFLRRFAGCTLIGLDLSMRVPLEQWNPFDLLFERDSSAGARPDITFLSTQPLVPVVGLCLVEPYEGAQYEFAHAAINRLVAARQLAIVDIDTRLDENITGLRTPAEVESLLARMDVVITTRLHGMVLALKNGVPALAIDPQAGGAKIVRQAAVLGWPVIFTADALTDEALQQAFDYCLTEDARAKVRACRSQALNLVTRTKEEFLVALAKTTPKPQVYLAEGGSKALGTIKAHPNPIRLTAQAAGAVTTLEWSSASAEVVEVRVDAPDGPLLSRSGPMGSAITGAWVHDEMTFYLQDVSQARPLTPEHTLAVVTIQVITVGGREYCPPVGRVRFGGLRRMTPISRKYGLDRGRPLDRYYIESFLARHAADVRGRVMEIGDDTYTRQFGADRVAHSDILHVTPGHPKATLIADLASADHLPANAFDCVILTQTLHLIYDLRAALRTLHRVLKPGGVLLATFPGISQIADNEWAPNWYWAFTTLSAHRMFAEIFPERQLTVEAQGNVLTAISFLHGLAAEELLPAELDYRDPAYQVLITTRAVK